jgi:hypothetical protein
LPPIHDGRMRFGCACQPMMMLEGGRLREDEVDAWIGLGNQECPAERPLFPPFPSTAHHYC